MTVERNLIVELTCKKSGVCCDTAFIFCGEETHCFRCPWIVTEFVNWGQRFGGFSVVIDFMSKAALSCREAPSSGTRPPFDPRRRIDVGLSVAQTSCSFFFGLEIGGIGVLCASIAGSL